MYTIDCDCDEVIFDLNPSVEKVIQRRHRGTVLEKFTFDSCVYSWGMSELPNSLRAEIFELYSNAEFFKSLVMSHNADKLLMCFERLHRTRGVKTILHTCVNRNVVTARRDMLNSIIAQYCPSATWIIESGGNKEAIPCDISIDDCAEYLLNTSKARVKILRGKSYNSWARCKELHRIDDLSQIALYLSNLTR